jgi:hypothetical protein
LNQTIVYTALMGDYEALIEQPTAAASDLRFVCFTDNPELVSSTWEVVVVPPRFPWDPTRSARFLKIAGPPNRDDYDRSLWIDNRVVLRRPPEELLAEWLSPDVPLALPHHSYRQSVADEFAEVLRAGYDQPDRVREQLKTMRAWGAEVLEERPLWTAMLARAHSPGLWEAMDYWIDLVLRHSRRDQLSVNYALSCRNLPHRVVELDNHESTWHEWRVVAKRESVLFGAGTGYTLNAHARDAMSRRAKIARHRYAAWRRR